MITMFDVNRMKKVRTIIIRDRIKDSFEKPSGIVTSEETEEEGGANRYEV